MEELTVTKCLVKGYQTVLKHNKIIKVFVENQLLTKEEELSILEEAAAIMEQYEALFLIMSISMPPTSQVVTTSDVEHFISVHFGEINTDEKSYILSLF